ncbi:alginate lyase family protein [Mucilaginibacter sp. HMF5004]|uniref:alginate lyase family protein n=1 Tax=Mucilaginibacter rivuli TaxID=2857527 RepID=UPI001C5EA487|nr:alginate lyase family protein [Mucilaginibacter rivuli]MBW4891757.1 alginate lyase family protein [Mucilaginibacter rivuli]
MKRVFLFTVFALCAIMARAQYVGLNDKGIKSFKALISTDADAKKYYDSYLKLADQAVNENPNPIDTIRTEGLLQGHLKKIATIAALRDMRKMYALAICYKVENEKSYLQNLRSYLTAWAKVNKGRGDPIDDTNMDDAIEAYDMVKANLKPEENALITTWFKQVADAEIKTFKPEKATGYNNWHSHRLKVIAEIAYAIDDAGYQKFVVDGIKKQVEVNLYADGSGVDFKLRDALHYHAYDLEPLIKLAIVLKRATGVDYYSMVSPSGSSIKKSTEWFVPYVTGEKTHGEFVNSTVLFDKKRAANGEKDYVAGTLFNPKNGIKSLAEAAYFDPQYIAIIKKVKSATDDYSEWQLVWNKITQN